MRCYFVVVQTVRGELRFAVAVKQGARWQSVAWRELESRGVNVADECRMSRKGFVLWNALRISAGEYLELAS